jgi:spore maturation protein CgeB
MPMWFVPKLHRPVMLSEDERRVYGSDVTFVGHYEPDGRVEHLRALVQSGLAVRLFGGVYWTRAALGDLYDYFAPVVHAQGQEYVKALCGAKVCLSFLSKLNRDTYTRRCFEIPACGRVMLAERTEDLLTMFVEDKEACFFSTTEELVAKATWLMENPDIAESIAQAGLRRVWADGHDIGTRVTWLLDRIGCHPEVAGSP